MFAKIEEKTGKKSVHMTKLEATEQLPNKAAYHDTNIHYGARLVALLQELCEKARWNVNRAKYVETQTSTHIILTIQNLLM